VDCSGMCEGSLRPRGWRRTLRAEDCYSHVSPGYPVVRSHCSFNRAGRQEVVDRAGCGRGEQRHNLRDWPADGAVWVHSCQSVLYRSLRGEFAVVEAGTDGANCGLKNRLGGKRNHPPGTKAVRVFSFYNSAEVALKSCQAKGSAIWGHTSCASRAGGSLFCPCRA
jgi:hypothetical protein